MSIYNIRPHHGLCLHFFAGEGYSPEFVANMTEIKAHLKENPTVTLVAGADSVCKACPNRVGERDCRCDGKVLTYDQRVVELCGLRLGTTLPWDDFFALVRGNILSQNRRETVCGDCQWSHLCQCP
ncbi:MAG: DUF1284 domain-containing protein [Eubacteriales bacterium]